MTRHWEQGQLAETDSVSKSRKLTSPTDVTRNSKICISSNLLLLRNVQELQKEYNQEKVQEEYHIFKSQHLGCVIEHRLVLLHYNKQRLQETPTHKKDSERRNVLGIQTSAREGELLNDHTMHWKDLYSAASTYNKQREWEVIPMLPPVWIMVLHHLQVSLIQYAILKWTSRELTGLWRISFLLSKVNTLNEHRQAGLHLTSPKGKPLGSPWLVRRETIIIIIIIGHPDNPSLTRWTTVVGCTWNKVLGR